MLSTNQKGAIVEAQVTAAAVELGLGVWRPVVEGCRYDLILEAGERLLRTQCKWANREGDVVVVRGRTCRHTPRGYVRSTYSAAEVDGIAAGARTRTSATSSRSPTSTVERVCTYGSRRPETTRNC